MAVARKERNQHFREVEVANQHRFTLDYTPSNETCTVAHWQGGHLLRSVTLPNHVAHALFYPAETNAPLQAPEVEVPKAGKPRAARAKRNPIDDK